jgi:hypothetical protein
MDCSMALWPDWIVYAVPQVIAAAAPMGAVAVQMGALVGLVRVLMLGPVCVVMALIAPGLGGTPAQSEPYRVPFLRGAMSGSTISCPGSSSAFWRWSACVHSMRYPRPVGADGTACKFPDRGLDGGARARGRSPYHRPCRRAVTMAVVLLLLALGTISLGLIHLLHLA